MAQSSKKSAGLVAMNNLSELSAKIIEAEKAAREAAQHVDKLKNEMVSLLGVGIEDEGAHSFNPDGYKITVTCKINRTVDGDKLQELAHEAGLFAHLQSLFRWKPSIDMKAWKSADESITAPLLSAITAKAGKPAVKIEKLED